MAVEQHGPIPKSTSNPSHHDYRFEGDLVVTLYVGADRAVFCVHESLLFDASPVFKAALSGGFKEASDRSMSLPEDDRNSVGRMVQWLYTGTFDLIDPVCGDTSSEHFMQLAQLNTLAEKYDIYLLKNDIVDALFERVNSHRPNDLAERRGLEYLYNNMTRASTFRKLMVAWYVYEIDLKWYEDDGARDEFTSVSRDFVIEVAMALGVRLAHPDRKSPFDLPSSDFHEKPPKNAEKDQTQEGSVNNANHS